MLFDPRNYSYRISYSVGDGEWVATCDQFPRISHLDKTGILAYCGVVKLVQDMVL